MRVVVVSRVVTEVNDENGKEQCRLFCGRL